MAAPAAPPPAAAPSPKVDAAGVVPPAQVSASSIAPPIESTRPKAGSAREAVFKNLEKYAKPAVGEEPPAAPAAAPPAPAPKPGEQPPAGEPPPKPGEEPPPKPGEQVPPKPGEIPEPDRTKDKPTKDFWRAFDAWKDRAVKAETQLSEATKGAIPEAEKQSLLDRIKKSEDRAKELEDHIRFVDYSKSEEFQSKYQKPYEQAWERAMSEVSQIKIKDASGEVRNADINDLAAIVQAPLMEARAIANQVFGDFADDVMAFRKEIASLNAAQRSALEEAKKTGAERQKLTTEQLQRQQSELQTQIKTVWDKANEVATSHPEYGKFFKPVDGDQEINQRLAKGFELTDRAFSENPRDPNLTPEQRASIIKRHAAVRNRAAAFGRLVYENSKLTEKLAAVEKELAGFKSSTPGTVGQPAAAAAAGATELHGMDRIRAGLQKIAKPG